jgi:hypothetical protein
MLALAIGCSDDDDESEVTTSSSEPPPLPPTTCDRDEIGLADGSCLLVGIPDDMECPPGETMVEGSCVVAGVAPGACGAGATHDGDGGCELVLPATPCGVGEMAVIGETTCRPVAPCGTGTWGDIPVELDTHYVDGSFSGSSDGSAQAPWSTIQQGVDTAPDGAIVAVATGTYDESVVINHPVRLWGRCPAQVSIQSSGIIAALGIITGADGATVRGIAVTGDGHGVVVQDAEDVVLASLWSHDTTGCGLAVDGSFGPSSALVDNVLIEGATDAGLSVAQGGASISNVVIRDVAGIGVRALEAVGLVSIATTLIDHSLDVGVLVMSSNVELTDSSVRDTQPNSGSFAVALGIAATPNGPPSSVAIRRSVILRHAAVAVQTTGSDLDIEATVIRDIEIGGPEDIARAITATDDPDTGQRGNLTIHGSLIEGAQSEGIAIMGTDATIDATWVRNGLSSVGIAVGESITGAIGTLTLERSLLSGNQGAGLIVQGGEASIDATVISDTTPDDGGSGTGRGIVVQPGGFFATAGTVDVSRSIIERNHQIGAYVSGSTAIFDHCLLRDTQLDANGRGSGVYVRWDELTGAPGTLDVSSTIIDGSTGFGVSAVSSLASLTRTLIRDTKPFGDGLFGDGISNITLGPPESTVLLDTVTARDSARAAISSHGGTVDVKGSTLLCAGFYLASGTDALGRDASFADQGGNHCGCAATFEPCKAMAAELAPPEPL